jgi:hypothetical protein
MENAMNNCLNNRRTIGLLVVALIALPGALHARDRGFNQPGALGNPRVAGVGVGAPGVGAWDPGINQPGAVGNVGVGARGVGVGAPGVGVRDPGFNQPGAVGNTGVARRSVRF